VEAHEKMTNGGTGRGEKKGIVCKCIKVTQKNSVGIQEEETLLGGGSKTAGKGKRFSKNPSRPKNLRLGN